jgi:hypothetical protein
MSSRRFVLAALAALTLGPSAMAADRTVTLPAKKLFPYLDAYLSLAPGERSRFAMAYRALMDGKPAASLRLVLIDGATRTPLPIDGFGRIGRQPSLAQLRSNDVKVEVTGPQGHKFGLALDMEPAVPPAAEIDAHALALACDQATAGARKAAGVMGFAAPRLDRVVFEGAGGGQAITAAGRAVPLAVVKGEPVFDPAKLPDARTIRLSHAPRRLTLAKAS